MSKLHVTFATVLCLAAAPHMAVAQSSLSYSLPTKRMLSPHNLERMWWNQATLDPSRDIVRHLTADENVVIVQSRSGLTTVFDISNGRKLWAVQIGRVDSVAFPAITNDDYVMIASGTALYALQKFTGKLIWKFDLPAAPSTSPAIDDDQIYVGSRDGSVYAFDLRKITKLHKEGLLPQWSAKTLVWRYKAFKEVTTPPISTGRVVNFASRGGSLYSVTATDRKLVFQFETDHAISAPMAQSPGFLYLPSEDFKLYCLNAENGRTRWVYNTGLPIRKQPKVIGQEVFLTPSHGGLHVIDRGSGRRKWWRNKITGFIAASPTRAYVSDNVGNLIILNREDGAVVAALPLRKFRIRLANARTDRIIIATQSGLVACIREKGQEFPIYHMHPERRPLQPEFAPNPPVPSKKLNP